MIQNVELPVNGDLTLLHIENSTNYRYRLRWYCKTVWIIYINLLFKTLHGSHIYPHSKLPFSYKFEPNHTLNGSSSPVLTATLSFLYRSLCDFLTFFPNRRRSHPSTDFDAEWLKRRGLTHTCAFCSKNRNFLKPLTLRPPKLSKLSKFAQFWSGQNFRSISPLTLGVSRVNTPYSSSEPNKSVIVNRQCGGEKVKYVPKLYIGVQVTWYRAFALDRHFGAEYLENAWI